MNSSFQSEQLFDTFQLYKNLVRVTSMKQGKFFLFFMKKAYLKIAALMIINGMAPMSIPMLG